MNVLCFFRHGKTIPIYSIPYVIHSKQSILSRKDKQAILY
ncbi:hypothetical protein TREAZ_1689 [Leadbettera azotonutricia ZAS-9]|uniref:Uncharacterized protein n=1 Tax=Leadbettera azotonutricia (strain ATCC BAA-888 / DSM 13862 / ZAS-9) TaxID=545695 RepID=F5YCR4_LEAAZ|nr:hypothetical protein TREAZ_1689 [Leadbettera azotonutricia ZAS-9]